MSEIPEPITAPPDKEELAGRLAKVRALMEEREIDYYISFDPVNIYYLTNFANNVHERPFILILPRKGTPTMLCPLLESKPRQDPGAMRLRVCHLLRSALAPGTELV